MVNARRIIKRAYPDESYQFGMFILWDRTSFPFGDVTAKTIYKAASRFMRASNNKIRLCDLCDNKVDAENKWICNKCIKSINEVLDAKR